MIHKLFINRNLPHINRYKEIIAILAKHGFDDFITKSNLDKYLGAGKKIIFPKKHTSSVHLSRYKRIRIVLEELGPAFIKLGQVMSNRPDLVPGELVVELEKLQSSVPPFDAKEARKLIEQELKKPISDLFYKFYDEPVASASIAQVHKAVLTNGDTVAIKIQRPDIEQVIKIDLEIMHHIAMLAERHIPTAELLNLSSIVKEFERTIKKELDFSYEASHIERFIEDFRYDKTVHIPRVYKQYSTKKILTMEFIDGIKITDISAILKSGSNPKILADRGANAILKQIFEHGFFHADPHPGNIFALKNNVICFLDFGMVGTLLPKHKEYLSQMIIGIITKDTKKITHSILQLSQNKHIENIESLEYRIFELLENFLSVPLRDINTGEVLNDLLKIIIDYKLKMPPNIYLLLKALINIEGVGRKLNPNFNIMKHLKPKVHKILKMQFTPKKISKDMLLSAADVFFLLRDLPMDIKTLTEQIKQGHIKIEFEHRGLENMLSKHDQISNRISFAIVLAALIIGSSLIVLSGIPPIWNGIPIIGILGFLAAGIMGFWLLISILRHGKM